MSQADIDIQLKVWKDLALSKQILMGAATEALGLHAECSTTELKDALDSVVKTSKATEIEITQTREKAEKEVSEMQQQVATSDKARTEAEEHIAVAEKARETAERQMTIGRAENSEAIKKARADVADKQNKLKAISKALADTPENVVKKLKNLKKQKFDESKLRTQAETKLKETRKEKSTLETELEEQKALVEKAATLVAQVREFHALCQDQNAKIKSLSEKEEDLFTIPEMDEELLESLQAKEDEAEKDNSEK
ncbi:MAG: hypothetical protein HON46_15940 [Gammaproteobacteria bacterium]|nr:hypothetical protein [Gammaproteobacteria bacterium]MBT4077788.1 hypothetical protein [Gammaproteobacteria bacterium]MBT4862285.1 hypothetical protein [Gammaproteobacteria bacterium]MBT7208240.1 hypothetical protein [Gammaproteobacteria bacterium]